MKDLVKEFREFIATGNMIELAVAVILGAAAAAVIKVFTEGIVMQIVAAIVGEPNFDHVRIVLRRNISCTTTGSVRTCTDAALQIGTFVNALITLLLTGLALFTMIKAYNTLKRRQAAAVADVPLPTEVELLMEIRDALRARD